MPGLYDLDRLDVEVDSTIDVPLQSAVRRLLTDLRDTWKQIGEEGILGRIESILEETRFPSKRLKLEITETAILEDRELALGTVQSLKNVGISISLDDFGTGYSNLRYLERFPLNEIKIDRSFVREVANNNVAVATYVETGRVAFGHGLRTPVIVALVLRRDMRVVDQHVVAIDLAVHNPDLVAFLGDDPLDLIPVTGRWVFGGV
mgnify:CR=1 FL=1